LLAVKDLPIYQQLASEQGEPLGGERASALPQLPAPRAPMDDELDGWRP
jgi:hypothetical protein